MWVKMFTFPSPSKILRHSFLIWSDCTINIVLVCPSSSQSRVEKNLSMHTFMSLSFNPYVKSFHSCMSSCHGSNCTFPLFASIQCLLYIA
jgi:hypothetical protein